MGSRNSKSFTRIIIGVFLLCVIIHFRFLFCHHSTLKGGTGKKSKTGTSPEKFCLSPLSKAQIFDNSTAVEQLDCRLWNFIRKNYLIEPSNKPYNLENPEKDPNEFDGQNKYVLEILNNMKNGFFVECGAWDGETLSATLRLERDFGWTGLLVEPNSKSFSNLKLKNRKAWAANFCLSPTIHPQMVNFVEVANKGKVGWWYPALSSIQKHLPINIDGKFVKKPCFPTFAVLSALNVTIVDFFLLDIEGAELDVLKTIPFDKILIKVFSIEWNHVREGKRELLRFMLSKGYKLAKDLQRSSTSDFILVHESVPLPPKFQNATMIPVPKFNLKIS